MGHLLLLLMIVFGVGAVEQKHNSSSLSDYLPTGPQINVPTTTVLNGGWKECYISSYGESTKEDLPDIINNICTEDYLMMGCRYTGESRIQLLAWASREDVLYVTNSSSETHEAEGTSWYFYEGKSWGFAIEGQSVNLVSCDTDSGEEDPYKRLCWHLTGYGGYRCGEDKGLNDSDDFQKLIFQRQEI